ncbi:hypothetical protein K9E44_00940 [Gardnerella vaginalis]|uniref:hypothetical protein n=1 Tax=Gardnerella vaginalis TaxID=2702 RepID=UPI0020109011|nr:hypothetical protein [Gardnerella vaginalis]UQA80423.1 hypothetical protein K9E44_00940 [Gardnerella vaginalis]
MRYAISSSVKALIHANNNVLCVHYSAKQGRDSRFFAASEASLSAEGGDSPREQEKSRISAMKTTQKF